METLCKKFLGCRYLQVHFHPGPFPLSKHLSPTLPDFILIWPSPARHKATHATPPDLHALGAKTDKTFDTPCFVSAVPLCRGKCCDLRLLPGDAAVGERTHQVSLSTKEIKGADLHPSSQKEYCNRVE